MLCVCICNSLGSLRGAGVFFLKPWAIAIYYTHVKDVCIANQLNLHNHNTNTNHNNNRKGRVSGG
jgi:hypothetical protein